MTAPKIRDVHQLRALHTTWCPCYLYRMDRVTEEWTHGWTLILLTVPTYYLLQQHEKNLLIGSCFYQYFSWNTWMKWDTNTSIRKKSHSNIPPHYRSPKIFNQNCQNFHSCRNCQHCQSYWVSSNCPCGPYRMDQTLPSSC